MTSVEDSSLSEALCSHGSENFDLRQDGMFREWQQRASKMTALNIKAIENALMELDAHLTLRSYVGGHRLSNADLWVWGILRQNRVAHAYIKQNLMINLCRWFRFIEDSNAWIAEITLAVSAQKLALKEEVDGNAAFEIGLPDTEKGVVTRFPPEPSGYLHIGHAKAALLNDYFAHERYKGTLILRFDDTNPMKEKQEFQDAIIEDLALLGIHPDRTTHTSDYFQELYEYCVKMITDGNAYADDTLQQVMRDERMDGIASKRRNETVENNLKRFEEMKSGSNAGQKWFIRAKISVDNPNKAMRDPVIYRCSPEPHHRTGTTWKIYPTYDFCCPLIDALEGVTHALRTTEYNDRDAQYQWMLRALKLRHVYNWNFSRLNMIRTLLSKRKLTKFINEGVVESWSDPRMATVRGIRRRGMTIPALREYIIKQGPSKNIVLQDWSAFWATNKAYIDKTAARYTAIDSEDVCTCNVLGARAAPWTEEKEKHAKHSLGTKKVTFSSTILIGQEDAASFEENEEITLMNWGNAIVHKISHSLLSTIAEPITGSKTVTALELELHLQGDVKKTKKKVTWLSQDQDLVPVELVDFDYLITKDKLEEDDKLEDFMTPKTEFRTEAMADCNVAELKENDIFQFDRKGYYRVDRPFIHGKAAVMFQIPTGKK